MAAAFRTRIYQISQKYLFSLVVHPKCINHKLSFHSTPFMWVVGQQVKMPSLSPTMTEGTIVKWLKKEGDAIHPGDILCDIQTDKAVVSLETDEEGILAKIMVPENTPDVKVGTLIALTVPEGEDWKSVEMPSVSDAPAAPPTPPASTGPPVPPTIPKATQPSQVSHEPRNYGPAVRQLLEQYGLDLSQIKGSGRGGKVLKGDVLQYIQQSALKPKPPKEVLPPKIGKAPTAVGTKTPAIQPAKSAAAKATSGTKYKDIELSNIRRVIAKRLSESKKTIPHAYGNINCNVNKLLSLRKKLKESGVTVSVNDFVLKAVASALVKYPAVNVLWVKEQIVPVSSVDICVAVATESGLITPIVKNASCKGLQAIAADVKALAEKAKAGKLQPQEFQGGSFTVSNLGMFGVHEFSAIINPPQCAILAVGAGRQFINEQGKPLTKMTVTLSYDNRAIDEFLASEFLTAVRDGLEEPSMLSV